VPLRALASLDHNDGDKPMNGKNIFGFAFTRIAFAGLAALALASTAVQAEVKAKLGHAMPDSHPQAVAMNKFAELVGAYTKGNVKIQTYAGAVLGSDEKQLQAVQAGTQEFYIGTLAPLSTRVKEVQIWDLPFMFQSDKEVYAVLDGASSKKIFEKIEPSGLVGLTWTGMGFRNLSNSKHPVNKVEDVSGLKVRVMANPVALETWKTIGANAVPMAFAEVFPALEIKALDGQENPLLHMYANKMQEVQKYISITNHVYTPVALVASKKFWDTLKAEDKAGIQKAATEAGLLQRKLLDEGNADVIAKFKSAGVAVNTMSPAELARMQDKVKPVVAKFAPVIGEDFVKGFYAEIDKARAAGK
jgi:tripartite ATP-independent transporter DctP family solute receptor